MNFGVNIVGGGYVHVQLDAVDLRDVAEQLRRERGLIGRIVATDHASSLVGQVLIPASRIALVSEA